MTRTVELSCLLAAPADRVWEEVNRPRLLLHVARPMIRFAPIDPPRFPERWADGPHLVSMRLGGVLPLGRQVIEVSRPAPRDGARLLLDRGRSASIRRWDHLIAVAPEGDGTRYTDRVEIDAGPRTPLVAAFARRFYAHRQRRWRRLAASGFDYGAG